MKAGLRSELEQGLRDYYRLERDRCPAHQRARDARVAACVSACREDVCDGGAAELGWRSGQVQQAMAFLFAQVRHVRLATWAAFALVTSLVVIGCALDADASFALQALPAAGGATALICLADVTRSRAFGMTELEGSCPFNAVSVALARLLLMGVASVFVLVVGAVASGVRGPGAAQAVIWMATPYLLACAGGLMCARRVVSADARGAAIVWASGVAACAGALYYLAPAAYAPTAEWLWLLGLAGSAAWCFTEVRIWIAASGNCFVADAPMRCA